MGMYDKDDAFADVINAKRARELEASKIEAETWKNVAIDVRRIANSESAIKKENARRKKIERAKKIKIRAVTCALVAILGAGLTTSIVYGDTISTRIEERRDYDDAIDILSYHQLMVFNARRLSNGVHLNNNDVEKYKDLNITTMEEVYVYLYESRFTRGEDFDREMDKLIQGVSYYDENRNIVFYSSFSDFLGRNGFENEEQFKKAAKKSIIQRYREGKIKPYFYEGASTYNISYNKKGK